MVRKKAAVCGEERCVTSLKTAAKETSSPVNGQFFDTIIVASSDKEW